MVRNLQVYILFIVYVFCLQICHAESSDFYFQLVKKYQQAYNKSDFSLLDSLTFTQKEYDDLISKIDIEHPGCLTAFDKTFNVTVFEKEFKESHLSKLKTDTIVIDKISDFTTCSNLDIRKISCYVYFSKENKSVPVSLIVINLKENQHKILLDIINENYFENEKF